MHKVNIVYINEAFKIYHHDDSFNARMYVCVRVCVSRFACMEVNAGKSTFVNVNFKLRRKWNDIGEKTSREGKTYIPFTMK